MTPLEQPNHAIVVLTGRRRCRVTSKPPTRHRLVLEYHQPRALARGALEPPLAIDGARRREVATASHHEVVPPLRPTSGENTLRPCSVLGYSTMRSPHRRAIVCMRPRPYRPELNPPPYHLARTSKYHFTT
jgi:hypothetical protein